MSERISSVAIELVDDGGSSAVEVFERKQAELEAAQKDVIAERTRVNDDAESNKKLAPGLFEHYGGGEEYKNRLKALEERQGALVAAMVDLRKLYSALGGGEVDRLLLELKGQTRGKDHSTWSARALATEQALKEALKSFEGAYAAYREGQATPSLPEDGNESSAPEGAAPVPENVSKQDLLKEKLNARKSWLQKRQAELLGKGGHTPEAAEELTRIDDEINRIVVRLLELESSAPEGAAPVPENVSKQERLLAELGVAREEFIAAKVSVESSFFKKWFGGIRRHERLDAAREAVAALEAKVAKFQLQPEIDRIREDMEKNEKGADEERQAINSLMTLHVFKQIKDVENAAAQRYDQALEERSGLKKFMAKIGNFFVTGGKIGKWLKPMGAGFGVGAATGLFAMWPITTAVGIASSAFVGAASKQAALQERAGEKRIGDDEEQVSGWLEMLNAGVGTEDVDARLREIAERAYGASTEDSRLRQDELRKRVRGAMGKYSVGFALGGLAGHYGSSLAHEYFGGEAEAVSGSGAEGSAGGEAEAVSGSGAEGSAGGEAEAVSGSGAEGSAGGERVTDFVDINTNAHGPEHALQDLLKLSPGETDALMGKLQNAGFDMGRLFVDSSGNPVEITNYGGKIGYGFTTWNSNLSLELTAEAKKVLKALGYAL